MYSFPTGETEQILRKGHASLHKEGEAWTGAFYLTSQRLVFIGYMMDITRKYIEDVTLDSIREIRGGKTFGLFSNVLNVTTLAGLRLKIIVEGRDSWLAAIRTEIDRPVREPDVIAGERQFFNERAERWDDLRSTDQAKIEQLIAMAAPHPGDRVLDVGCGTGILAPYLKKMIGQAGTITAVDFAPKMIARAVAKFGNLAGVRFVAADIMDFASGDDFDLIVCLNFFPHMADKPAFLARMNNLLSDRGSLVVMHDIPRDMVNGIHQGAEVVTHDRLPAGEATAQMFADAGYEVTAVIDNEQMYFVKGAKRG